jgi:hypothetical protein
MRIAAFLGLALVWACGGGDVDRGGGEPVGAVATAPAPEPEGIRVLDAETVRGWTGPGDRPFEVTRRTPGHVAHLHRVIGRRTFVLSAREPAEVLIQYPCTSCHEGAVLMADRIPDAHRNIQPRHPSTTAFQCSTCHVSELVQLLSLPDGSTTTMDHAYQLCSKCHYSEVRDWAAGVHGKRLEGWFGRRVVMNCADCHDPHNPALALRIPFAGPAPPRTGGSR